MDDRCDLTDLLAFQKYAEPFQLMVVKAIIITVKRRGKELGTAEAIRHGTVFDLFEGNEQPSLMAADRLDS